ncbi:MAG: biotin transporter BioY [Bdellovibrionota bacterium]
MKTQSISSISFVADLSASKRAASILILALITGLSAMVKIPLGFTPVPISLQTAVVLAGALWLGRDAVWAQLVYLLLGCVGLPFFTTDLHGVQVLYGPTGGYLVGFVAASYVCAKWIRPQWETVRPLERYAMLLACSMLFFIPGVIQLSLFLNISMAKAMALGFAPFVVGDLIKTALVSATPSSAMIR